jgi:hypothetical protein
MAGFGPAIYESRELVVKIVPGWIAKQKLAGLPGARVALQVPFPLARLSNVIMALRVNEAPQAISLGESFHYSLSVLPDRGAGRGYARRLRVGLGEDFRSGAKPQHLAFQPLP